MSGLLLRDVRLGRGRDVHDVLVRDGRVAATARSLDAPAAVEVVDGGGAVLLPGLVDAHVHLAQWALARRRVDVAAATSAQEAAALLTAAAGEGPDLLVGHGFRDALWAHPPHRRDLDAVLPDRPVVVVSADLHCAWVNSAAAARWGVAAEDGVVREEAAMALAAAATPAEDVLDAWVLEATRAAAARGVTAVVDLELAPRTDWVRRAALGAPAVRVAVGAWPEHLHLVLDSASRSGDPLPGLTGDAAERLRTGPLKLFADGSLGTRTAFCRDPYPDGSHGVQRLTAEELAEHLRVASRAGVDVAVHAIGDAAVTTALDGFAAAGTGGRIEHAQQVADADLPRFARLGVVASVQPRHAPDDRDACAAHWRSGTGRAFRYADLLAAGAELVLGSDAPVAPLDPWDAVASAVHRSVDGREPWRPEQHLSLEQALPAASGGRRQVRAGDVADLVLVEHHPAEVLAAGGAESVRRTEVLLTLLGGATTHRTLP